MNEETDTSTFPPRKHPRQLLTLSDRDGKKTVYHRLVIDRQTRQVGGDSNLAGRKANGQANHAIDPFTCIFFTQEILKERSLAKTRTDDATNQMSLFFS